ncbi:MAG: efflux RND transporter permease subunit [Ignavibacteria bacterium]|jgi:HAE1 family hydrophobic/amphiphilic exporter-1|nr:efflux RND transporter permease subunit [Ignavibacteria bacterium]MCU7499753.1 efflux RND transporter permease subunit [Ignavibacteria bacterium]MCU7511507.1 efflux RND transporter permease subunit [Ignavibacteria bacterium]MCU7519504.1 efflux RND transporter permease subunit [Ignavibacteria bacterium]MCU7524070.1 efflux RND transporter permease subunit [Ignavibacteria bacterium]
MTITELAIKRSTLVVIVFTALSLLGLLCYSKLNYDLIPKVDVPIVAITTVYPGASAGEVENSVTKKLEDALSALENVKSMSSSSMEGYSAIVLELVPNTNVDLSLQDAQRKVNGVLYQLPEDAKTPSLLKFSTDEIPVLKLGVYGKIPATKLYQLTKDQIKPQLAKLSGVGMVTILGGDEREIRINVNRDKLAAYKISIAQLYAAVSSSNMQFATGKIEGSKSQYTVRLSGKVASLEQLKNVIVYHTPGGSDIRLSDVAEIVDGIAEYTALNRINGENSIGIMIQKQSDANSVEVSQLVKNELKVIEQQYQSSGVRFDIASDNSVYTLASADAVMEDLGLAILLVAIVMFLFLHSFRNSLIVLVSIPTSIISVFTGMYIFNFSLNIMTLMALSLVIGILVDDSIVVLENIYRHLAMGKDKKKAALDGRNEIGFTAVAITMVDVVVFVPMALISGMIGNIIREFSLVVVFSTLMSLFVSFTITPLLASRFSKIERLTRGTLMGKIALGFEDLYKKLVILYEKTLRWGLNHKLVVSATVFVLFIASFLLLGFGFIGSEFMPESDRGEFLIQLEGEAQNNLHQTNILTEKVEKLLFSKPEVTKVFANVGYSSSGMGGSNDQQKSELTVTIIDKKERNYSVQQYAEKTKQEILAKIPGLKVTAAAAGMFGTAEAPIQILLRGSDMNEIYKTADQVMGLIKNVPGVNDINLSVEKSKPEVHVSLDRDKMSMLGLSVADVGTTLQLAFAGSTNLQYSENGTDYDINVMMDKFDRTKIDDLGSITFVNSKGEIIELRQFANIYQSLGPNKLERYGRMSSIKVQSQVFGRPVGTVGDDIKKIVAANIHNNNVSIEYIGQLQRQSEAFSSLLFALVAAILLVYFVMVALYNSYLYPFVVLFSLPVATIGALLALALAGQNISMFVLIGIIMLMGLVAKNAILLVDFTNKLKEDGRTVVEALVEAGKERLRPILMTTIAMVIGMIPLAISSGASSESKNGLAWVIIGGLTSSLMLTLILVPSVYMVMENLKVKFQHRFAKKKAAAKDVQVEVLEEV